MNFFRARASIRCQELLAATAVFSIFVFPLMTGAANMPEANAAQDTQLSKDPSNSAREVAVKDAGDFINTLYEKASALNQYSVESSMELAAGKHQSQSSIFYFKKPHLIRSEQTGAYRRGSIAVVNKDGQVRAHLGGAMKFFVATLSPDAKEVRSINGYPMYYSDFASLADFLVKWNKKGIKGRVTVDPMTVKTRPDKVYVVEMFKESQPDKVLKKAYISPTTYLPVEWYDYENGNLFAISGWKNLKTDVKFKDSFFSL